MGKQRGRESEAEKRKGDEKIKKNKKRDKKRELFFRPHM